MSARGTLWGVGLGPGDPELVTVKAARVVIGRNVSGPVSGPNEDVRVVKLADLNPAEIDMRCLLIVGSSQTRWYSVDSQDRVFTPRRYPEAGRATATKSSRHSD